MLKEILFLIVVFLSNIIQAITGFAGTLLAMPASIMLVGINTAKAVLNVCGLLACLYISIRNYKHINKNQLIKITILMFLGMFMGIYLFKIIPLNFLLKIYGVMIVLIALKNMFIKKKINLPEFSMILIVLLAGLIHGMFVSGGALLVIYATSVLKDKSEFRATLSPVWVMLNTFLMINHIVSGFFDSRTITLTFVSIIPLFIGITIGNILHHKINQNMFLKLTYILLLISGISILV